jgi:uncharacterized protein
MMHDDGRFEWDEDKAALNAAKHGVTFAEACEVLADPLRVEIFDDDHSLEEQRYQLIGLSSRRLLFVVFTERNNRTRIVHARKANKTQERFYVETNS